MQLQTRINIERKIVSRIVKDALANDYKVSVFDSEEYVLKRSQSYKAIMEACFSTDDDTLVIRDNAGEYIGSIALIYGNCGYDVVSDYTYNETMETLLSGAFKLANKLEEQHC